MKKRKRYDRLRKRNTGSRIKNAWANGYNEIPKDIPFAERQEIIRNHCARKDPYVAQLVHEVDIGVFSA